MDRRKSVAAPGPEQEQIGTIKCPRCGERNMPHSTEVDDEYASFIATCGHCRSEYRADYGGGCKPGAVALDESGEKWFASRLNGDVELDHAGAWGPKGPMQRLRAMVQDDMENVVGMLDGWNGVPGRDPLRYGMEVELHDTDGEFERVEFALELTAKARRSSDGEVLPVFSNVEAPFAAVAKEIPLPEETRAQKAMRTASLLERLTRGKEHSAEKKDAGELVMFLRGLAENELQF